MKSYSGAFQSALIALAVALTVMNFRGLTPDLAFGRPQSEESGAGILAGRILRADGTPAVGVHVTPLPITSSEPERAVRLELPRLVTAIVTRTDRSGRYHLENIQPGRYYLAVGAMEIDPNQPLAPIAQRSAARPYHLTEMVYFPPREAGPLIVASGRSVESEFHLPPEAPPTSAEFQVSGQVNVLGSVYVRGQRFTAADFYLREKTNLPILVVNIFRAGSVTFADFRVSGTQWKKVCDDAGLRPVFFGSIAPDGAWEARHIPPGAYTACVNITPGLRGTMDFNVVESNIVLPPISLAAPAGGV